MLDHFFESPIVFRDLKSDELLGFLDSFAEELLTDGFAREHSRNQLRRAGHFCIWSESIGLDSSEFDDQSVERFVCHLPKCDCPGPRRGSAPAVVTSVRRFLGHLRSTGSIPKASTPDCQESSPLLEGFLAWMREHRGIAESTVELYRRNLADLLQRLGEDPSTFTARKLRRVCAERLEQRGGARNFLSSTRMFLRYLASEGKCPKGLDYALPSLSMPSPQGLPKYLPPAEIENLIESCDAETKMGIRDRAILLLLARLGLRAGEVADLRLSDVSWDEASLRVRGKARRESLLPLPQEAGDAILRYLECARPQVNSEHLFLTCIAPFRPFASGISLSLVVRRALGRAGIEAPSMGAHLLRHSLATELLRQGAPLHGIAAVLRHRSIETTTIYTKVDVNLLGSVVQPWPGVSR